MVSPDSYKTWPSARGTNSRSLARRSHSAADNAARRALCCGRCRALTERFFISFSPHTGAAPVLTRQFVGQEAVEFLLDDCIAFADALFELRPIHDRDTATTVVDHSGVLQLS